VLLPLPNQDTFCSVYQGVSVSPLAEATQARAQL
jgi:hypothetical protein